MIQIKSKINMCTSSWIESGETESNQVGNGKSNQVKNGYSDWVGNGDPSKNVNDDYSACIG